MLTVLGAPGPQNLTSSINRVFATVHVGAFDTGAPVNVPPNRVFTPGVSGQPGTLEFRRRITDMSGAQLPLSHQRRSLAVSGSRKARDEEGTIAKYNRPLFVFDARVPLFFVAAFEVMLDDEDHVFAEIVVNQS